VSQDADPLGPDRQVHEPLLLDAVAVEVGDAAAVRAGGRLNVAPGLNLHIVRCLRNVQDLPEGEAEDVHAVPLCARISDSIKLEALPCAFA